MSSNDVKNGFTRKFKIYESEFVSVSELPNSMLSFYGHNDSILLVKDMSNNLSNSFYLIDKSSLRSKKIDSSLDSTNLKQISSNNFVDQPDDIPFTQNSGLGLAIIHKSKVKSYGIIVYISTKVTQLFRGKVAARLAAEFRFEVPSSLNNITKFNQTV